MLSFGQHGFAQTPEKKADSTSTQPKGMQAYNKVITDKAKNKSGLFTVSQVDAKYYFQIPDSLFNRYMLVVTRYLSTPEGMGIFGGEKANEQTIYFEKGTKAPTITGKIIVQKNCLNDQLLILKNHD